MMPIDEEPEPLVGSVFGFRWWRVGAGGVLRSPWHGGHRWSPDFNDARCLERRRYMPVWRTLGAHVAPDRRCSCGFYGLWSPPRPEQQTWVWEVDAETSGTSHGLLFGVVEVTGKVMLAAEGFRAQYARPVALAVGADVNPSPDIEAVAMRLPARMYRSIDRLLTRYGVAVETSRGLTFPRTA
jgi:hypothetical protein